MSNVLISVPSEWIRYYTFNGVIKGVRVDEKWIPFEWMYGDDSTEKKWNEFFNSCISGHMRINEKIIISKRDLLR